MLMRIALVVCVLSVVFAHPAKAQEEPKQHSLVEDTATGYALTLPLTWREVTEPAALEKLVNTTCALFLSKGRPAGMSAPRGFALPGDTPATPRLAIFALDYAALGLRQSDVAQIATSPTSFVAGLANAMQTSYLELFPQSIMVNSHLGEDFFTLNLRSVLDFADEHGTTQNRHLKVMLTATGAIVLLTLYEGPPTPEHDQVIPSIVRTLRVVPEKAISTVNPPYQASFLDYALFLAAIAFVIFLIRRRRG